MGVLRALTRRHRPSRPLSATRRGIGPTAGVLAIAGAVLATTLILAPVAAAIHAQYYVAIGGSETLGFQGTGPGGTTRATSQGYTNDLVEMEQARWPDLQLALFACPGLRVDMALSGRTTNPPGSFAARTTSGRCDVGTGSEVAKASTFIRAHRGQVSLVTVDLGYSDVAACMTNARIQTACVAAALARIRAVLPVVVSRLREAGGSSLRIVGLDHEDPSLGYYLEKPEHEPAFAKESLGVTEQYNQVVHAAYANVGVRVAQVSAAFATATTTPTHNARWGTVPLDLARICILTWMCTNGDIHPNVEGYRVIADTIIAAS